MQFIYLLIASIIFSVLLSSAKELPTSLEELPAQNNLPDLFQFDDGKKVKNLDDWKERRKELIEPLMFYQYGFIPPRPDKVTPRLDKEKAHPSGTGKEHWIT